MRLCVVVSTLVIKLKSYWLSAVAIDILFKILLYLRKELVILYIMNYAFCSYVNNFTISCLSKIHSMLLSL